MDYEKCQIPTVIRWGFDPHTSSIKALDTETGRRIWGYIRTNHIVDQYFSQNVEQFAALVDKRRPRNVYEFRALAVAMGLGCFGNSIGCGNGMYHYSCCKPDWEWWSSLYDFVMRRVSGIKQEYPK